MAVGAYQAAAQNAVTEEEEAAAQEQQARRGGVTLLQRIVVGAGQEKVAIDTPQAVTVIDQQDIDREQATTTGELFKNVPGVSMTGSSRALGEAFNIRGIGSTDNSADGSRIIITVDGAQKFYEQYRVGSFFSEPELYKKVEVLRGPASSTLYGSGALGGVVNFVTKDASDFIADDGTGALRLKGAYETNGDGWLGSAIWAHRFSDNLEVLVSGNHRRSDKFKLGDGSLLDSSDFKSWSGLAKGTYRFGDTNEQTLRLSYQRWDSDNDDQAYSQTGTFPVFGTVDRHVVDGTFLLSYENPATDNDLLDLKATLSYSNTDIEQENGTLGNAIIDANYGYRTWQGNLQNTSRFTGDSWESFLTYGTQLTHQKRVGQSQFTGTGINTHPEGTDTKLGLFVQNEFIWDERLTIISGVRGDFAWRSPSDEAAAASGATDVQDQAWSPKIAALYKVNDSFNLFGSIAHTQRLPTLDELYTWSKGTSLGLKKEKSNNYEAGFSLSGFDIALPGDSASFKATGFYNSLTDMISTTPGGALTYFHNIGKADIYGIEVEAAYDADLVFANLAYTGIKGTNRTPGVNDGKPLATIPAHKIVFTLGGRLPDRDIEFGGRVTHAFDAPNSVQGTLISTGSSPVHTVAPADSWTTVDLFASWKPQEDQFRGWEFQVAANNIFDSYYRDNLSLDYTKGRTFKFTLSKQFNY